MLRLGVRHLLDEGRQRRRGPCRRQVPDQRDAPVGAYAGRTARGRRTLQRRTAALAGRFPRRGDEGGMPHAVVARHQEHHLSLDADRVCDQRRAPFVRDRDGDGGETFRGVHLHRKHHRDEVGIRLCQGGRHTDRLDEQPPGRRIRRTGVFLGQPLGGELHVGRGGRQGYADARRVRKGGRGAERLQRRPAGGRRQRRLYDRSGRLLLLGGRTFQGALHELSRMADRKGRGRGEGLRRHPLRGRPAGLRGRSGGRSHGRTFPKRGGRGRPAHRHRGVGGMDADRRIRGCARRQRQDAHGELFGQRRTGGNLRHARRYGEEPAGGRLVHDDRNGQGDAGCRRRQVGREGADRGVYEYGRHRDERRCERYDRYRRNLRSGSCGQRHRGQYQ